MNIENYYNKYGPMVLRRCRQMLADEEAAVDAMQDTFVKLLRYEETLNNDSPTSLLYRIATNVCLNHIRTKKRKPEESAENLLTQIACTKVTENRFIAANLLAQLFKKHLDSTQTMATLHLLDGLTLEEVAKETGLSVSGVRKRLRPLKSQLLELQEGGELP